MRSGILLLMTFIILFACNGSSGGGGSNSVDGDRDETRPKNPCTTTGKSLCTETHDIDYNTAMRMVREEWPKSPMLTKGTMIKEYNEYLDSTYIYNDETKEYKEVKCKVFYNRISTILKVESENFYFEEKNEITKITPDNDDCNKIREDHVNYNPRVIAKDKRWDLDRNIANYNSEAFKGLKFQILRYKGKKSLRIHGTVNSKNLSSSSNSDGNAPKEQIKTKWTLDTIVDFNESEFGSTLYQYNSMKGLDGVLYNESLTMLLELKKNVDVSHINIDTMDPRDIDDRTTNSGSSSSGGSVNSFSKSMR
ncbi:MAG: hypothetical protein HON90_06915 [Halobacteriovoraceae bacterium]|jgi:hypothetical protein|nr:hypothetical protein [Halobacteriovoraceae bacterium]